MAKTKFKKMPAPTPEQIRAARKAAGITQADAAAIVQGSLRNWCAWESGERPMHPIFWAWFLECAEISTVLA